MATGVGEASVLSDPCSATEISSSSASSLPRPLSVPSITPPAKDRRSQRHQAVLTPTEKDPLDCTPSVHQLSENLDRGPPMEGAAPSRRGGVKSRISRSFYGLLGSYPSISQGPRSRLGEAENEEGEEPEETEVEGAPDASEAANLAHYNQPLVSQAEPNFLKMMEKMTQFMGQLTQAISPRDNFKSPTFSTPSRRHLILLMVLKPIN
ncbi:hypothetical protein O181_084130 [Austropuccinia psidii MF-1]|uniref:Uncharacterized protein n=1 Tax=Austropuccinia psidii MF-1 TaxID=1389203 RepID=A0A9Q3FV15_9BASI|nr:hypothetical protein [Austropuccinia psidii MF-1]